MTVHRERYLKGEAMPQQPDKDGRVVVSKKINAVEWDRTVGNCRALPGRVTLDVYVEEALAMKNDYTESNPADVDMKSRSKIIDLVEDLAEKVDKLVEQDTFITYLKKQMAMKDDELAGYKKV